MEINVQFQSFVNFAQAAHADGKDKQIARVDIGPLLPTEGAGLYSRTIVAANGDKVAPLWRSRTNKDANNVARDLFRQAVIDIFGGMNNVPKNVMDAMLMKDYGVGKPLTARRILAVQAEVAKASDQFDKALAAAKTSCAGVYDKYAIYEGHPGQSTYAMPKADLDRLVETAVKTALKDKDALEIVTKNLPAILVRGDAQLRTPDKVQSLVAELVGNVEELRAASAGNQAFFKAGLLMLGTLRGKSARPGVIASIIHSANAANISNIKKLSGSSSGEAIHKAVESFTRLQEDLAVSSGAEEAFEGADEKVTLRDFIAQLVVARCGRSATAKIQAALSGENAQKLAFLYNAFENGNYPKADISKGLQSHISIMASRASSMLNQLKLCVDSLMGIDESEFQYVEAFKTKFDTGDFGAGEVFKDLKAAAKKQSTKVLEGTIPDFIQGNGPAADAIRAMVINKIGLEPGENPNNEFEFVASGNITSMMNWNICSGAKTFALGDGKNSIFAKDLARDMKVTLPGGKRLSNDFAKALDELAEFVTKGAKKTFAELDAKEKNKVYIVTSLLSQETGKAAFDGQFTAFDPANFSQPIVTGSDQDADEREFKLSFNKDGRLVLDFEATQNLQVITVGTSEGKTSTFATPTGSTAKSNVEFTISADEFERLAELDFTKFNDDATYTHMAQKTGKNKLGGIPGTFAEEFRLDTDAIYTDSAIKFDIKDEEAIA